MKTSPESTFSTVKFGHNWHFGGRLPNFFKLVSKFTVKYGRKNVKCLKYFPRQVFVSTAVDYCMWSTVKYLLKYIHTYFVWYDYEVFSVTLFNLFSTYKSGTF